jgi:DNA excision repair protein ERCC-2
LKRQLNIPVRTLVEHSLRSGDLSREFVDFSMNDRAMEGIRAHRKIRDSRPDEYRAEVTVTHRVEIDDFIIDIDGRLDGVYEYPDNAVVDEIKSTTRSLETYEKGQPPVHWGQVKVYAYIYAAKKGLKEIDVQLTYYNIHDEESGEFRETFRLEELETFFLDILKRYLKWAETLEKWAEERDESIKPLKFPFPEYRPGQRRMALDIYHAVKNGEQLIVEAPTGIGKTIAAVFPVVKGIGNGLTQKFFYLTAKTTGRAIAEKALANLRHNGLKFKALTLTAREKICFNPEKACNGEECIFARGFYDRINEAVETTFHQEALTREAVEKAARLFNVCPFEFSLELALWVDAIICDYNYAFDPRVYLRRFFIEEGLEPGYTFLVDEANNLVDRSREMFSAELLKGAVLELRKPVKKDIPKMYRDLGKINSRFVELRKECKEAKGALAKPTYPDDFLPHLRRFIHTTEQWLAKNGKSPISYRDELLALYFEVSWFLKVTEFYGSNYAACMEEVDDDFRLKLFCMDPALLLSETFSRCRSVIFFSATLSPVDYFRQVLGCSPQARVLKLPSPFPAENLCLPVVDRVSTLYRYREQTKMDVAKVIDAMVKQKPGNYLVFFPSYQYLKMVHALFAIMNPFMNIQVQSSGMSEGERDEFLKMFSEDNLIEGKTLVGFAVMGGVFGEGIDLAGDRLSGAVIVGVGLPGISLERELLKEYFTDLQGTGFEYAYLYPGMNRVFQAAGRVIRTADDCGVVLLIGQRFSMHQYKNLFPHHWRPARVRDQQHLEELLTEFWKSITPP